MRKTVRLVLACLLLLYPVAEAFCQKKKIDSLIVKQTCLKATITAIQLEINRYQGWIDYAKQQNDTLKEASYQVTLDSLKKDLSAFQRIKAEEYMLPQKKNISLDTFGNSSSPELITTTAWVEESAKDNTILNVEGMSRNGPWFHLAGIVGDKYEELKPGKKYRTAFYTVYARNYWNMASAYVCIISIE